MEITIISDNRSFTTMACPQYIPYSAWEYFCSLNEKRSNYLTKNCARKGCDSVTSVSVSVVAVAPSHSSNRQNLSIMFDAPYDVKHIFDVSSELFAEVIKRIDDELRKIKDEMNRFSGFFKILQPQLKTQQDSSKELKNFYDEFGKRVNRIEDYLGIHFETDSTGILQHTLVGRLSEIERNLLLKLNPPSKRKRGAK